MVMNKNIENTNIATPTMLFPQAGRYWKTKLKPAGANNIPCARMDNIPAMIKRVIICRGREKFFMGVANYVDFILHDPAIFKVLLTTLKVLSDIIFQQTRENFKG